MNGRERERTGRDRVPAILFPKTGALLEPWLLLRRPACPVFTAREDARPPITPTLHYSNTPRPRTP
jgi:hypothetical protein